MSDNFDSTLDTGFEAKLHLNFDPDEDELELAASFDGHVNWSAVVAWRDGLRLASALRTTLDAHERGEVVTPPGATRTDGGAIALRLEASPSRFLYAVRMRDGHEGVSLAVSIVDGSGSVRTNQSYIALTIEAARRLSNGLLSVYDRRPHPG